MSYLPSASTVNDVSYPVVVSSNRFNVLTTGGTPADIATISIPPEITRYHFCGTSSTISVPGILFTEGASPSATAARFTIFTSTGGITSVTGGNGTAVSSLFAGPAGAGVGIGILPTPTFDIYTQNTLYVRQTVDSVNTGALGSIFLTIYPLI